MTWQTSLSWEDAQLRAALIQQIRMFFSNKNVIEVETPLLSNGTITDMHIDAFNTRYNFLSDSSADKSSSLYLQTSPEFAMKRLLASGYGCIYQLCKAFRHEEFGRYHNPEFTMLEWYRIGYDHKQLMAEVAEFLVEILQCAKPSYMTYQEAFVKYMGIDPLTIDLAQLKRLLVEYDLSSPWLNDTDNNDTLLQYLFTEIIEPKIGLTTPCFIYNFPSSQASLAKISEEDERVAQRFECYYKGIELANGFHELTDVKEQVKRFEADNELRQIHQLPSKPIDQNFILALASGLPDCSGVALGIDRLLMLALRKLSIKEVITYNIEDA